jgi:hypothetical protein
MAKLTVAFRAYEMEQQGANGIIIYNNAISKAEHFAVETIVSMTRD